jgi:fumarate hydratase class II
VATSAANKFEAPGSNDAYVFVHGAINSVATGLSGVRRPHRHHRRGKPGISN